MGRAEQRILEKPSFAGLGGRQPQSHSALHCGYLPFLLLPFTRLCALGGKEVYPLSEHLLLPITMLGTEQVAGGESFPEE